MAYLFYSLVSLALGPLTIYLLQKRRRTLFSINVLVAAVISALVAFGVAPELWQSIGFAAPALLIAGFLLPTFLEKWQKHLEHEVHSAAMWLALFGLIIHAMLDGAALYKPIASEHNHLPLAVVLHRFPEGLAIWWLLRPGFSRAVAILFLAAVGIATISGYAIASTLHQVTAIFHYFQAFVAGALLHVIFFRSHQKD